MKLYQITETIDLTRCNLCSTGIISTKCAKCGKAVCQDCVTDDGTICRNCSDTSYNKENRLRTESVENFKQDNWYRVLRPEEHDIIERLLSPRAANLAPDRHRQAKFFIETMATLEELMPFNGNRINFMSWWHGARKNGLLTYEDENKLVRFCIDNLYF